MDFTVTIKDQDILDGITWARTQDCPDMTDAQYVQFRMQQVLQDCAIQKTTATGNVAVNTAVAVLKAKFDANK